MDTITHLQRETYIYRHNYSHKYTNTNTSQTEPLTDEESHTQIGIPTHTERHIQPESHIRTYTTYTNKGTQSHTHIKSHPHTYTQTGDLSQEIHIPFSDTKSEQLSIVLIRLEKKN